MELKKIKIDSIVADENIRSKITKESIEGLVSSLKENGLLQPILVSMKDGKYNLIAGFRRLAAMKLAGMTEVNCIIGDVTDENRTQVQLVENIQREELNPIDEAKALQELLSKHKIEDLAMMAGKTKLYIEHRLRLLDLPKMIQEALKEKKISAGHGVAISRLHNKNTQEELFKSVICDRLSISQTELHLERYSKRLDGIVFDKTECRGCIHNGTNQKDFFDKDTELKGSCMDESCFSSKIKAHLDARKKVLKEKNIPMMSRDEYYNDKERSNWRTISNYDIETVGKAEIQKEIADAKNIAVIFDNESGAEQIIIKKSVYRMLEKRMKAAKAAAESGKGSVGDPEEAARKERQAHKQIGRVDETKRRFLISRLIKSATKEQLNRIALEMLFGTERSQSETISEFMIKHEMAERKKPNYEVRHNLFNVLSECENKNVESEILRISRDNIEAHSTDEIISMAEEIKINMSQFVIDEEYLNKFTKAELALLIKEFKLKSPKKFEMEGKSGMIAWILKQNVKEVPKELTK